MKFLKMFFAGLLAFVVGSAVMLFLSVVILFGIVGSMTSSEPVTVGEHAILKLDFSEDLIESPSSDPFAGIDFATMTARHQVTLYNALRAIETAKNDPRIQGIYLRPNGGGVATYAILEELREALQDFRQGGKFIIAYNETYGQGGYYLASVADKIYLEPHGGMQWTGFFDADVLQGSFRQARYSGRNFPSDGLQVQECRGALFPFEDVECQPRADAVVGGFLLECDGGGRRRVARYRAFDLEPTGRRARSVAGTGGARCGPHGGYRVLRAFLPEGFRRHPVEKEVILNYRRECVPGCVE